MPGRLHQRIEIDEMVGMVVGDNQRGDVGDRLAGGNELLGNTGPAIDQHRGIPGPHQMRRTAALRDGHGASGAEKGEAEAHRHARAWGATTSA